MAKPAAKKLKKTKIAPAKKLTRKELRKQKQEQKKQTKRLFFSSKTEGKQLVAAARLEKDEKGKRTKPKKSEKKLKEIAAPEDIPVEKLLSGELNSEDESIASDFTDEEVDAKLAPVAAKKPKLQQPVRPDVAETHRRELQRQKDLMQASRKQRIKQLVLENEEEDRNIAQLEKKLKLNKTKDKNRLVRKMFNDGLDYALEFCLNDDEEAEKRALKAQRKEEMKRQQQQESDWSDDDPEEALERDRSDESEEEEGDSGEVDSEDNGSEEVDPPSSDNESEKSAKEAEAQIKEDIYGRKRDQHGNIIKDPEPSSQPTQKYIPPHQRALQALAQDDNQAQLLERLHKHCKGLLNRLSEANLHKIAVGIEELYMKNSRHSMNETLTRLLNEALICRTIANERMVQEHMVLLAYLHAHIGSEIGAHFLQTFITQFEEYLQDMPSLVLEDKRLNNLVLVLSYLYIFKIYEHRLLLEIIAKLADKLCEKAIECLLLIFQSVGFKLRKDDPLAFKQMMLSVQKQIAAAPLEMKENLRLKFMVDILNAVKNNNIKKLPKFDPELAENLRKRLKAMLRNDKYVVTLNITMDDLLRADQVGKWWVVGSAWTGNINDLGASTKPGNGANKQGFSEKLLALAKQQKMHTEEWRNIFCIIMSAEDYVDAFEKILHLSLKDQRSIAYIVIHCCLNEQRWNPYYAHLALKFCTYHRKFQLAFQFAAWDRINEIEALKPRQIKNLAQFLRHLILNGGVQLAVLKVVDFLQLNKLSFLLMKEVAVGLLLAEDEKQVYQAFEGMAKNSKLKQFKNSLRLFLQHFLLKEEAKVKLSEAQSSLLKKRLSHVDNLLAYVDL